MKCSLDPSKGLCFTDGCPKSVPAQKPVKINCSHFKLGTDLQWSYTRTQMKGKKFEVTEVGRFVPYLTNCRQTVPERTLEVLVR